MVRKPLFIRLGLAFLAAGLLSFPVRAQGQASVVLRPPDTGSFPSVSLLMDVYDAAGQYVPGLTAENVSVLEDGQPIRPDGLDELPIGVEFIVAVNPGAPLGVRDATARSRYDKLADALRLWAEARPDDSPDDMSLVASSGPLVTHVTTEAWLETFLGYQPDTKTAEPGLQALSLAIDLAAAPAPQAGMKRAVLFITPHMEQPAIAGIEVLAQKAAAAGVRVHVWWVDSEAYFTHSSATALQTLAGQTGGSFTTFDGTGVLPNPESYLMTLRSVYRVRYTSALRAAGTHTLAASIQAPWGALESPSLTFEIDIQPPGPILVSPPERIERRAPEEDPFSETLLPASQDIEIIIEFPDGHPRALRRTALYVDGVKVDENTSAPFDEFTWDLGAVTSSGEHSLQAEAEDTLGLSGVSMAVPVTLTVIRPQTGVMGLIGKYSLPLTVGAIVLVGLLLALILFSGSRARAHMGLRRRDRRIREDPLTQPVSLAPAIQTLRQQPAPQTLPKKLVPAPAYLVRLTPDGLPTPGTPIALLGPEMTFGTDPVQATHVIDDPSISSLHARLRIPQEDACLLSDQGSVAGTWVNYEPIGREGRRLEHGDVIHFGKLVYRFTLRKAGEAPPPRVDLEKPVL